jgi:hypothetical protein
MHHERWMPSRLCYIDTFSSKQAILASNGIKEGKEKRVQNSY